MYSHVLPCIAIYSHVVPCIAIYWHVLPCVAMLSHVLPCIAMYYHVLSCIAMCYHVLLFIAVCSHVLPCITMYSHVLKCIDMYYHLLPCIVMYRLVVCSCSFSCIAVLFNMSCIYFSLLVSGPVVIGHSCCGVPCNVLFCLSVCLFVVVFFFCEANNNFKKLPCIAMDHNLLLFIFMYYHVEPHITMYYGNTWQYMVIHKSGLQNMLIHHFKCILDTL